MRFRPQAVAALLSSTPSHAALAIPISMSTNQQPTTTASRTLILMRLRTLSVARPQYSPRFRRLLCLRPPPSTPRQRQRLRWRTCQAQSSSLPPRRQRRRRPPRPCPCLYLPLLLPLRRTRRGASNSQPFRKYRLRQPRHWPSKCSSHWRRSSSHNRRLRVLRFTPMASLATAPGRLIRYQLSALHTPQPAAVWPWPALGWSRSKQQWRQQYSGRLWPRPSGTRRATRYAPWRKS